MPEVTCPTCQASLAVPVELMGQTVLCTACQRPFQTPAAPAAMPLPPHLAARQPAQTPTAQTPTASTAVPPPPVGEPSHEHADQEQADAETASNARSGPAGQIAWMACWLILLVSAITALAYFNPLKLRRTTPQPEAAPEPLEEIVIDPWEGEVRWSERDDVWLVLHRRKVRILAVRYEAVRTKDDTNTVRVSDRKYLQIDVRVMNATTDTPTYTSWFQLGKASTARLEDDQGRRYPIAMLVDARRVKGHTATAAMTPLERIDDVLVFEIPEGVTLSDIRYLRLTLPAAAWGDEGEMRFQIANDRIKTTF